jgi:endoglucanase
MLVKRFLYVAAVAPLMACQDEGAAPVNPDQIEASGEAETPSSDEPGELPGAACPLELDVAALAEAPLRLLQGINLGNRLDAPSEGAWGPVVRPQDLTQIAERGFDHVRLPVRFSAHAGNEAPYAIECAFLQRVDAVLELALSGGLSVVLDVHHYDELMDRPTEHASRFVALWQQLAQRYSGLPGQLAFDLLNEPRGALDAQWNALARETLAAVRRSNPTRRVIINAPNWARFQSLAADTAETRVALELPSGDPSLMAGVHLYEPSLFCFQGVDFQGPAFGTRGLVFPGPPPGPVAPVAAALQDAAKAEWFRAYNSLPTRDNPLTERAIDELLDQAVQFREASGYDVYVGEWCHAWRADAESRAAYVSAIREGLERRQLGGAVWDTAGPSDLLNFTTGQWLEPLTSRVLGTR